MNWVLKGLKRLENNKEFSPCQSSDRILSIYRKESDTVGQFLKDKASTFAEAKRSQELYEKYSLYCYDQEFSKLGSKQFAQELVSKGVDKERRSQGMFYNVHKLIKN